jgi:hypothetical protein
LIEFCCGYCSGLNKNKEKVYNFTLRGWKTPRVVADIHSSTYMVEYYYSCTNKACITCVDGKRGKKVFQKLSLFATYKVGKKKDQYKISCPEHLRSLYGIGFIKSGNCYTQRFMSLLVNDTNYKRASKDNKVYRRDKDFLKVFHRDNKEKFE